MQYTKFIKNIFKNNTVIFFFIIIFILLISINNANYYNFNYNMIKENMQSEILTRYVKTNLENRETYTFPWRYFRDENDKVLPLVAITGFFRDDKAKNMYYEYKKNGVFIFGVTAYKSFPRKMHHDDPFHLKDDFDYLNNIKDWLSCFRDPLHYGFTSKNRLADISESDLYDLDTEPEVPKKYDFIYICNKDSDECPKDGWNAINRNYKLAEVCFPILFNEYKLKGLVVGRIGCGLEEKYGDKVEITDFLPWHILQEKMREAKFLFVPNIYDASPRVVAECITKGLPVLMNESILCGFKYISYETGEYFLDEYDIRVSLESLLEKMNKINPRKWWVENYGTSRTAKKIRDFLYPSCPELLENVNEVRFVI